MNSFRVVADTNIFLSAQLSKNQQSPNKEFFALFRQQVFTLLMSEDCLIEYIRKLEEKEISRNTIIGIVALLYKLGETIEIEQFHFSHYPPDQDDIAFLLCALNGKASHLVTYDNHLLCLQYAYKDLFTICETLPFLRELRAGK
jgi:putative PIN family toxin of toxin-antitoxin system